MSEQSDTIDVEEAALAVRHDSDMTLGGGSTSLPSVEQQAMILPEFDKRRKHFFAWLKEHFTEGTHYGIPPGCGGSVSDTKQWRSKPCLYDSGARLFIDLFGLRPTYEADLGTWEMMGKQAGVICKRCRLLNKAGEIVGEGTGVFVVGEKKGMGEGSADKMAEKRARVSAVLDGIPYARELFTQDLDDIGTPQEKLRDLVAAERVDCEAELSTEDFLTKVAEQCLYGKGTITNNAEAKRITDALERGDFDWKTGERVAVTPKPPQGPQDGPQDKPVTDADLAGFRKGIARKRAKSGSSMTDEQFISQAIENEFGLTDLELETLDRQHYDQLCASLKAGKFDWATAERIPE